MINVKVEHIYNKMPYYNITGKEGIIYSGFCADGTMKVIGSIGTNKEEVDVESIEPFLEEHNKLIRSLESQGRLRSKDETNKDK